MYRPISNFAFIVIVLAFIIGVVVIIKVDPVLGTDALDEPGEDLTGAAVQDTEENKTWEDLVKNIDDDEEDSDS